MIAGPVYVNSGGWVIAPGQLPFKIIRTVEADGSIRIVQKVLDGATERIISDVLFSPPS